MGRRLATILAADMAGYCRLMEQDEDSLLERQKAHRRELIDPEIARCGGHVIKTSGDGMLVEFVSVQDALKCAVEVQTAMRDREAVVPADRRIHYRFGINLGDLIYDEGDVFGNAVNVAARLEGLSEPGGICISDSVYQTVAHRIDVPFRDMGGQRVKNIARPIRVWQWSPEAPSSASMPSGKMNQQVQFVTGTDGVQIAWAGIGQGAPLLRAPHWLNHLEYEWQSPIWRPALERFAMLGRFVRFDQRGNGMSDWDVDSVSEDSMVDDMLAVATAAGLERFALVGASQGCGLSLRFAARYPECVTCIVIYGGYLRGRLRRPQSDGTSMYDVGRMVIREGWGSSNPFYRHCFTSAFIPDAPPAIAATFDELQRVAATPEICLKVWRMNCEMDTTECAKNVRAPTLVLHCAGDRVVPVEEGQLVAKRVPGATFTELPGNNHIPLEGTLAFDRAFEQIANFLEAHNK